jgi:hypothetical protein
MILRQFRRVRKLSCVFSKAPAQDADHAEEEPLLNLSFNWLHFSGGRQKTKRKATDIAVVQESLRPYAIAGTPPVMCPWAAVGSPFVPGH